MTPRENACERFEKVARIVRERVAEMHYIYLIEEGRKEGESFFWKDLRFDVEESVVMEEGFARNIVRPLSKAAVVSFRLLLRKEGD